VVCSESSVLTTVFGCGGCCIFGDCGKHDVVEAVVGSEGGDSTGERCGGDRGICNVGVYFVDGNCDDGLNVEGEM